MATTTTNLGLTKPSQDEAYNIQVQNDNMEIIDEVLGGATPDATPSTLMTRDADGRAKVAAPSAPGDIAILSTVLGLKWNLLQSYTAAGTYTFTAPDLLGDGSDYDIGVFVIGAGGSGGTAKANNGAGCVCAASGGASGETRAFIFTVTPFVSYTVVVGAGGAAVSVTGGYTYSAGNAGGSSSFNGNSVNGGDGGYADIGKTSSYDYGFCDGANGGQGSDAMGPDGFASVAPMQGQSARDAGSGGYGGAGAGTCKAGRTSSNQCYNPFTLAKILGAGGGVCFPYSGSYIQTTPTLDDGNSAGAAAGSITNAVTTADSATSVGSGGGAAGLRYSTYEASIAVTSGAGADGAVYIYARGVAS